MNFITEFEENRVYEWKPLYVDYQLLIEMLQPFQDINTLTTYQRQFTQNIRSFAYNSGIVNELSYKIIEELNSLNETIISKIKKDIDRCDCFFDIHFQQIQIKLKKLIYNLLIYEQIKSKEEYYQIKEACKTLYLESKLLQQFAQYNQKAITKLLKIYKKQVFVNDNNQHAIEMEDFNKNTKITQLSEDLNSIIMKIQNIYFKCIKNKKIKCYINYKQFTFQQQLYNGIFVGISICLLIFITSRRLELTTYFNRDYDLYFPMFRGLGLLILYYWLMIYSIYTWQKSHVGYRMILGFKYHSSSVNQLTRRAGCITMIYLIVLILSVLKEIQEEEIKENGEDFAQKYLIDNITTYIYFPPSMGPLVIWIVIILYMCFPSRKLFNGKGRLYFWKLVYTSLLPILQPCQFANHWGTDQLLSLIVPLKDVGYTICYYYNYFLDQNISECGNAKNIKIGLILGLFPIALRFIQIFRQIYDNKKLYQDDLWVMGIYVEVSLVFIFSYLTAFADIYIYFWIASCFMLGSTAYFWDIKKDWGLMNLNCKYRYLRKQLAFPRYYYYLAIIFELFLRFGWILGISPNMAEYIGIWPQFFIMFLAIIEILRRTLWNIFRIENVHIQNMGQFRAVPEIILPYENYVDQHKYKEWKILSNQIDPINQSDQKKQLSNKSNISIMEIENILINTQEENNNLKELIDQENSLIKQKLYMNRRNESVVHQRYSQFRDEFENNYSENSLSNCQIRQELKKITNSIKLQN